MGRQLGRAVEGMIIDFLFSLVCLMAEYGEMKWRRIGLMHVDMDVFR